MEALDLEVATEFLLIAATLVELKTRRLLPGATTSSSTRSCCASRSATCSSPACSSARRSRTPPRRSRRSMRLADRSLPRRAGPEEPFRVARCPTRSSGVRRPTAARGGAAAALAPKPTPEVDIDHIAPIRASVRRRGRGRRSTVLPDGDAVSFRELVADAADAARGDRAVPRRASSCSSRASSTSSSRRTSATCACAGCARARPPRRRQHRRLGRATVHPRPRASGGPEPEQSCTTTRSTKPTEVCVRTRRAARHRSRRDGGDRARRAELPRRAGRAPVARSKSCARELADEYEEQGRGFVLGRVAGGYRFQTHPDLAPYVERFVLEGQHARLSGPRSRRWRSSRTSSRSPAARSPRSAASTSRRR